MASRKSGEMSRDEGFTLLEALVVLGILSIVSVLMILSVDGSRRAGMAAQAESNAQQTCRMALTLLERDTRAAGSGVFSNTYRRKNGSEAGEMLGNQNPDSFAYFLEVTDLEGFMLPPVEVVNGTDSTPGSYLSPLSETINLTNDYRVPNTDMLMVYSLDTNQLEGRIDDITGVGQENFIIEDQILGKRLLDIFEQLGSQPMLVAIIDDEGTYATMRAITSIVEEAVDYRVHMNPSNDYNQPTNFKGFLESIGYDFNQPGGPDLFRQTVNNDYFATVTAVTYFVYRHPDPAMQADGWLVRLDMPAVIAGTLTIDASDPDTIRPFVIAEQVSDFQVALGIDLDDSGGVDASEWINDEAMESYIHDEGGEGTVSDEFLDLVNYLRAVRATVVTRTDISAEDEPYGFARRDSANFDTLYSTIDEIAEMVGVSEQIEDHAWSREEILDRLWYHRAMQVSTRIKIRNLDLANTFARVQ